MHLQHAPKPEHTLVLVLARAEWETIVVNGKIERIRPVPDTWHDLRKTDGVSPLFALVACPRCHSPTALAQGKTRLDGLGKLIPTFVCTVAACQFRAELYLDKFHEKPLYALAMQNGERIELSYTHASSVAEASRGVPAKIAAGWAVIGIARAVGYHVQPGSKGDILIA
jgi:hypothetical protein